jgi:hypothetical protein
MGTKKKKEETTKLVSKILIVCVCVLFVGLMILSGMGTSWLTIFTSVKTGDTVVIDYTLFDAAGKPIVTTEKSTYDQAVTQSRVIFRSNRITITANQTMEKPIYTIPLYVSNGDEVQQLSNQLALYSWEYNAVSSGIIGMKDNDQRRIVIPSNISMSQPFSAEQIDLNNISVGDNFPGFIPDNSKKVANNTTVNTFLRIGEVANKSQDGIVVDFSYPVVNVKVVSINNR